MSDHEDIIDLNKTYANESCINTYSSDSNRSKNVTFLNLGSVSLDNGPAVNHKIIEEKHTNISLDINDNDTDINTGINESKTDINILNKETTNITSNPGQKMQIISIIDNNGWNDKNEK